MYVLSHEVFTPRSPRPDRVAVVLSEPVAACETPSRWGKLAMLINIGTGTSLDFAEFGDADGPPLVMICGTTQSYALWGDLAKAFSGHRVICYDHRGMGASERGGGTISMASLADDLDALLDVLGVARAHVLGWSLGSAVGQELAISHPDRVASLILWGTWPKVDGFQTSLLAALRYPWTTGDIPAALAALGVAFSPELLDSPDFASLMEAALPTFPQTDIQIATTLEQWEADLLHDTTDRLGGITAPTLVVAGAQDLLTPPWQCKKVADAIPGARYELFEGPGSSHALGIERAGEFVPLVLGFLADHPLG